MHTRVDYCNRRFRVRTVTLVCNAQLSFQNSVSFSVFEFICVQLGAVPKHIKMPTLNINKSFFLSIPSPLVYKSVVPFMYILAILALSSELAFTWVMFNLIRRT